MTVYHGSSSDRFFRPIEQGSTPRNLRKLQARRLLASVANVIFIAALALGGFWMWQKTREDARFAIRKIELSGIVHAPKSEIASIARTYSGRNLFRLDLGELRRDLATIAWVESAALEKKLPDTLVIAVRERQPVALVAKKDGLHYVDPNGVVFARLTPTVGDPDLPLIEDATEAEITAAVAFLESLRVRDPELHQRVSQIRVLPSAGFALWDRDLEATVRLDADTVHRWPQVYGIAQAEKLSRGAIEYADLRFEDRIVIRRTSNVLESAQPPAVAR